MRFVNVIGLSARCLGAMAVLAMLLSLPLPPATAQPCPDAEVVFVRGTNEPPGVGQVGQSFLDSLRWQVFPRSVGEYAINYPASGNFGNHAEFLGNVADGIRDARTRIEFMAAHCPNTKLVLGGYSQGAVVAAYTASDQLPSGVPAASLPPPMAPEVANHVVAAVLFGMPAGQVLQKYGAPFITIGPEHADKTIRLCAPGDVICSDIPGMLPNDEHSLYPFNGMTNEGAAFAASRL